MRVDTSRVNETRHVLVFSKSDVEHLLRKAAATLVDLPSAFTPAERTATVEWGETSIDSGLRKEPQLILRITVAESE